MKKFVMWAVRSAVTVMAIAIAAFLLVGCGDGASPNNDGLVDGFLVRVNEKPGAGDGPGTGTYAYKLTVSSTGSGATTSGYSYVVGQTVFINAGTSPVAFRHFEKWTTKSKGVTFADSTSDSTFFTMPANDVTVTANFFWNPKWGTFTDDRDGATYVTTTIGGVTWMAENLEYPNDCPGLDSVGCRRHGGYMYSCTASKQCNSITDVCPFGWHFPSRVDWENLITAAGGNPGAGIKLMSRGYGGTDEFGFTGLPDDSWASDTAYYQRDFGCTTNCYSTGYCWQIGEDGLRLGGNWGNIQYGYLLPCAVRCVKNE